MKNILILYNPYYQKDVIDKHLEVLIQKEQVAFGKIKSKLKSVEHNFQDELQKIYENTSKDTPLQLFLTDYSNLFVAKVVRVTKEDMSFIAPKYYKDFEIEEWYVITDLREVVRRDFENIRDNHLANFTTPNFANHTYALYGNSYVYPLVVEMKEQREYFSSESKHYPNVYKSKEFLEIKSNLITYSFGEKYINHMHLDSISNIISAELEFQENKDNPLYDFSSVVVKYAKTFEQELYLFMKSLLHFLSQEKSQILDIEYQLQGYYHKIKEIDRHKPNLGTYKFLLRNELIKNALHVKCQKSSSFFISRTIPYYINTMQDIRNETVHGKPPNFEDVKSLRKKIVGIEGESMVLEMVKNRVGFLQLM